MEKETSVWQAPQTERKKKKTNQKPQQQHKRQVNVLYDFKAYRSSKEFNFFFFFPKEEENPHNFTQYKITWPSVELFLFLSHVGTQGFYLLQYLHCFKIKCYIGICSYYRHLEITRFTHAYICHSTLNFCSPKMGSC